MYNDPIKNLDNINNSFYFATLKESVHFKLLIIYNCGCETSTGHRGFSMAGVPTTPHQFEMPLKEIL
jgi:hypothetical protein